MKNIAFAAMAALTLIFVGLAFSPPAVANPVRGGIEDIGQIQRHTGPIIMNGSGAYIGSTSGTVIIDAGVALQTLTVGGAAISPLRGSATIDFASTSTGEVLSSGITVTGAAAGDWCVVGVPTAAAALAADFSCFVTATNEVKVKFHPRAVSSGTTGALNGASPSVITATVLASSVCQATNNGAAALAFGPAVGVSGTTLTITGANGATNTVNYLCHAPVDPASGTFEVLVYR
jgi:hypothetical protein